MKPLGPVLRSARIAKGYSQEQLAEALGIGQPQVSAIEIGRRKPSLGVLEKWVDLCDADLEVRTPADVTHEHVLVEAMKGASPEEMVRAVRLVRALRELHAEDQERETWMLEARAGLVERPLMAAEPKGPDYGRKK